MNRFAHFHAEANGFKVHFIYERGVGDHPSGVGTIGVATLSLTLGVT
jgi:hypothetical protein